MFTSRQFFNIFYCLLLVLFLGGSSFSSLASIAGSLPLKDSVKEKPINFRIDNSAKRSLQEHNVDAGDKLRFDAPGSISAGGDGKKFTVGVGGVVYISAGKSVRLLPGTKVQPGGILVVKVKPRNFSHDRKKAITAKSESRKENKETSSKEFDFGYKVFPVPESETFAAAMNEIKGVLPLRVRVSDHSVNFLNSRNPSALACGNSLSRALGLKRNISVKRWGENQETIMILRT